MIKRVTIICIALLAVSLYAEKSLHLNVKTATYNGRYAPKHCFVAWITDANDKFVQTLEINGRVYYYRNMLAQWIAHSDWDSTDAITSASLRSHRTHTLKWDCTDTNGDEVAPGTYKVWVEQTENNNYLPGYEPTAAFEIEIGPGAQRQTFPDVSFTGYTVFKDIEITYDGGTSISPNKQNKTEAAKVIKTIKGTELRLPNGWNNSTVSIVSIQGKEMFAQKVNGQTLLLPEFTAGLYFIKVKGANGTYSFKHKW